MSIDQTYTVDSALAGVDVETLMTKAFELTHQIHEVENSVIRQMAASSSQRVRATELRAERDVIVREMQRRSDAAERALVTVEAAERVMRGVDETLASRVLPGALGHSEAEAGIAESREALDLMMERTTTLTCSLVKDPALSDRISAAARDIVAAARKVGWA